MCRSNNCPALTGATHILSTLVNTLYPPNPSYQYNTPHPNYRPFPLPLFPLTPLSLPPMNNRYMLGKLTILRLRDKAKAALGDKFDIRQFHDVVLMNGAVPLNVLEELVDKYIAKVKDEKKTS